MDESVLSALVPRLQRLRSDLQQQLIRGRRGELVRDGLRVVLVGPPNAGKSSLLNCLAKRPAAIVSPVAGCCCCFNFIVVVVVNILILLILELLLIYNYC